MSGVEIKKIDELMKWYLLAPIDIKENICEFYEIENIDFFKAVEHFKGLVGDDYHRMRIMTITENEIVFSNGNKITYDHLQDCCENNYADFSVLNIHNVYYDHQFDQDLKFKFIDGEGFLFGDDKAKIFIPCYSEQNGYYTTDIDIYYKGEKVLSGTCNERFD